MLRLILHHNVFNQPFSIIGRGISLTNISLHRSKHQLGQGSSLELLAGGSSSVDHQTIISVIDAEIAKLQQVRSLLANGGKPDVVTARKGVKKVSVKNPKKREMSPEARKRIGDAQRKRWAAAKEANAATPPKATKKTAKEVSSVKTKKAAPKKAAKRTLSPEARRRIADAQRKRWSAAKRLTKVGRAKTAKKAAKKGSPVKAKNAALKKEVKPVPPSATPEAPKAEVPI
jgi:hypothetical protein